MSIRDSHINASSNYTKTTYTVATLPTAESMEGEILTVTDSRDNPSYASGQVVAGSGTNKARVLSDGSNWRLHGWS